MRQEHVERKCFKNGNTCKSKTAGVRSLRKLWKTEEGGDLTALSNIVPVLVGALKCLHSRQRDQMNF